MRVLITGANRGLGLEFVRQLLARGDRVFATCRRPDAATDLQALKHTYPDQLSITPLAVDDAASIDAAFQVISAETDALDLLINNAAISPPGQDLDDITQDTLMRTLATNVAGPILMVQRYRDLLRRGERPVVVNISSGVASITGHDRPGSYAYGTSKAALNRATRALMMDLRADGIIAIVMDPGWAKTDMGGPNAWITPQESIRGMLPVIDGLSMADSGEFFHYEGGKAAW